MKLNFIFSMTFQVLEMKNLQNAKLCRRTNSSVSFKFGAQNLLVSQVGDVPLSRLKKCIFFFFLENDSQVILSTSKCFKMTPYGIKMHLESNKLQ
jgi:hypothetical protein